MCILMVMTVSYTHLEGKNIGENDKNSIIVHEEFAKQNNLK